jgi:hypothetical protein
MSSRIGAIGSGLGGNYFSNVGHATSGAIVASRTLNYLLVKSSAHQGTVGGERGIFINAGNDGFAPVVDFSNPWELNITGQSCNETAINITAASWAAGVATFNATAHTLAVGDKTTIAGVNPAGYNGVVVVTSVADANTFTAEIAADPGVYVSGGTSSRISNVTLQSYILEVIG